MTRAANILVVEDDAAMRESCAKLFRLQGYGVCQAVSATEALDRIKQQSDLDVVLTDLKIPGMDGLALLKEIKLLEPRLEVVLMTGYGSVKNAVEAMKHGAADYITKPFDSDELLTTISKVVELRALRDEVSQLRSELHDKYRFENIVGASPGMQLMYEKIEAARNTGTNVLICGESGTGKELVAKAIHYNGRRRDNSFVPVNCAAIPRDLLESELFGHKKGAFTGAFTDAVGLFRAAHGGTIFLDEIAEMPYATQAKLLRALQERRIRPLGSAEEIAVDTRVIASTNQNVEEAIRSNRLREDLYYRLAVIRIEIPPLRQRLQDIPALVRHLIAKFSSTFQRSINGVSDNAMAALTQYDWPGNVRELESVIENAFALGRSDIIRQSDLPADISKLTGGKVLKYGQDQRDTPTLLQAERELLLEALKQANGNKTRAAETLGVSRPRLYNMIHRHGLDV